MSKKKAVVIGAGVNGLVLSNYLQKNNYDVKIIEKSSKIGGACTFDKIKIDNKNINLYSLLPKCRLITSINVFAWGYLVLKVFPK